MADVKKLKDAWIENSGRIFNMVLQRATSDTLTKIQNHQKRELTEGSSDAIELLTLLRDVTHNLKQDKQGTKAIMECHVDMVCTTMTTKESLDEFYILFNARVSTVNAHGGLAGHRPALHVKHLARE